MPTVALEEQIALTISVADWHEGAECYSENFGFELAIHLDDAGWSEVITSPPRVSLGLNEHTQPKQGFTMPVFGASDIVEARRDLARQDGSFAGETETQEGMVSTTVFIDPDKNLLMIA